MTPEEHFFDDMRTSLAIMFISAIIMAMVNIFGVIYLQITDGVVLTVLIILEYAISALCMVALVLWVVLMIASAINEEKVYKFLGYIKAEE